MLPTLLLCSALFQAALAPSQPLVPWVDNDRVAVWDVTGPTDVQPFDAVVVSLTGNVTFLPKGMAAEIVGQSMMIDLKDHPVPPIANNTGFPLAFPRPGSKKILENARVIVWDYTWTLGVPTPMHFHDKDVVVVYLGDGDLQSTTPDGKVTVTRYTPGTVRFNLRDRTHTETLIRGRQRAIITELK
jgi:hypothetical protein